MRVLIIEDIGYSSAVVEKFLKTKHYQYKTVTNGLDALEILANGPPVDVVICDLYLPDMDGVEIYQHCQKLARYKRQNSQPPFILLTSTNNPKELLRAENAGFTAVFSKPFKTQDIAEVLASIDGGQGYIQKDAKLSRILVVDSQGRNQDMLQEVFANSGYKLMLANNPTNCLSMLKELSGIKAVITDLEFGNDMDANTLMTEIHQLPFAEAKPVCILLTDSKNMDLLQAAYLSGFDEVITYPVDKFNLKQKINRVFLRQGKKHSEQDTILIVDDVFFFCTLAKNLLIKAGVDIRKYQFKTVQNGYEALDVLKTDTQVKLVLADYALKDMDAYEMRSMYDRMHVNRMTHPVFALMTATDALNDLDALKDKGFEQVFYKPLNLDDLKDFVSKQLDVTETAETIYVD